MFPRRIHRLVEASIQRSWVVHGARALNKQLPRRLYRRTEDWDFFSNNPRISSRMLEAKIEAVTGDVFQQDRLPLVNGKGYVYRIISKDTGEEIADFMQTPNHKNLYKVIGGIRWETLEHAKRSYLRILSEPHHSYSRYAKARRDLARIEAFEGKLKRRRFHARDVPGSFATVKAGWMTP